MWYALAQRKENIEKNQSMFLEKKMQSNILRNKTDGEKYFAIVKGLVFLSVKALLSSLLLLNVKVWSSKLACFEILIMHLSGILK